MDDAVVLEHEDLALARRQRFRAPGVDVVRRGVQDHPALPGKERNLFNLTADDERRSIACEATGVAHANIADTVG